MAYSRLTKAVGPGHIVGGMITLRGSVGLGGANHAVDVMVVQYLLNLNYETTGLVTELPVTGILQRAALDAIKKYQRDVAKMKLPDGKISAGGPTFTSLALQAPSAASALAALRKVVGVNARGPYQRTGELSSGLGIVNTVTFLNLYFSEFGQLGASAVGGLSTLLGFLNSDRDILDIGWGAYLLATVKHECADRWLPIEEFGKGAGHTYGNAVSVTDTATGKVHSNKYFGRGYVQITWENNYKVLGNAIGLGNTLWIDPSLALDASVAYALASYGMRNGSFTSKKFSNYINSSGCDYGNARRIINGVDQKARIEGYAERLELLLRVSCESSTSSSF